MNDPATVARLAREVTTVAPRIETRAKQEQLDELRAHRARMSARGEHLPDRAAESAAHMASVGQAQQYARRQVAELDRRIAKLEKELKESGAE